MSQMQKGKSAATFSITGTRIDSEEQLASHVNAFGWNSFLYYPEILSPKLPSLTRVKGASISKCSFKRTRISNIIFTNCSFSECLFLGTDFDNCEFINCTFTACNMYKAKLIECLIDPAQFSKNFDLETDSNIAIGWFHAMYRNSVATSQPTYARESLYLMRVAERSQILHEIRNSKNPITNCAKYLVSLAHAFVSGYGQKTWRILGTFTTLAIGAAAINYAFREEMFNDSQISLLDSIYFTCITISTVGFGDVTPKTEIGKIVVSCQALLGPLFFTMALTEVAGRIMRRD